MKAEKPNGSYYVKCANCRELTHQRLIRCEHCGLTQNKEDEPVEWSETTTPDGIKVSWVCSPLSDRPTNKDTQNDEELTKNK